MAAQGLLALSSWGLAAWLVSQHPFLCSPIWMAVAIGLALMSAVRPWWGLTVLLGLLPVASLSIWSGWRVTDEFDVLVLLVLGGGYLHEVGGARQRVTRLHPPASVALDVLPRVRWLLWMAWAGVWVTWAASAYRGWLDAGGSNPDLLFGGYEGAGNVWRVAKSMVGLLLLAPWLHALYRRDTQRTMDSVQSGILWSLGLVCALAVWERAVYIGLWDLRSDYRTTAWFWEMHVGGGAIDVFLALTAPFAWWSLWRARTLAQWAVAAMLLVVLVYVVITTYSRGLAGVFAGGSVLFWVLAGRLSAAQDRASLSWRMVAQRWLLVALVVEALVMVGVGRFASDRLSQTSVDVESRWAHWQSMHRLLSRPVDWWWGIGQGRLPARHSALASGPAMPGAVLWPAQPEVQAVRLQGPQSDPELVGRLALARRVPLQPVPNLVHLIVSAPLPTSVRFQLCERHLLYELRCLSAEGVVQPGAARVYVWPLRGEGLTRLPGAAGHREGMAMFSVTQTNRAVDVFGWEIQSASNQGFLHHADFSKGFSGWFWVSTGYFRPWHADNLWMELWVERGLLGLLAHLILLALILYWVCRRCFTSETWLLPILVGLVSCGILSCVISVTELPRLSFLSGVLLLISSFWGGVLHDRTA